MHSAGYHLLAGRGCHYSSLPDAAEHGLQGVWIFRKRVLKRFCGDTSQDLIHKSAPHWSDDEPGHSFFHRTIVVVARPSADRKRRNVTDYPRVAIIVGGTGLDRNVTRGEMESTCLAEGRCASGVVGKNVGNFESDFFGQNLSLFWSMFFQHVSIFIFYFIYGSDLGLYAVVCKYSVGASDFKRSNFTTSKDKSQTIITAVRKRKHSHVAPQSD